MLFLNNDIDYNYFIFKFTTFLDFWTFFCFVYRFLFVGLMSRVGLMLKHQGRLEEAEIMYRRALEGRERLLGSEHPDTLGSVNNLGALLQNLGQLKEAEIMLRRALEGRERLLGSDHRNTLNSRGNLGLLLIKQNNDQGKIMVNTILAALLDPPHSLPNAHPWIQKFTDGLK